MRHKAIPATKFDEMAEIARRVLTIKFDWKKPVTTESAKQYLPEFLYPYDKEVFGCMFLDRKRRPICVSNLFQGRKNSIIIDPEKVVEKALEHEAAAVITFHCVDTLELTPAEKTLFLLLVNFLSDIQVQIADHILVCRQGCFSFVERKLVRA